MKEPERSLPLPLADQPDTRPRSQVVPLPGRATPPSAPISETKQPRSLWYALHLPQLAGLPKHLQQQRLEQLAELATAVSSSISLHPCALVFEIRSSLRYFGGIDSLHETLAPRVARQLQEWQLPGQFHHAAAPTVSGSLLLARSGLNQLVYRRDNLRSALGSLSTDVLEMSREQRRRLYNMGVRRLRDLWRLPGEGLRKRFGSDFVNQLHSALGERPEPQRFYLPPPVFNSSYELPCEVENTGLLIPVLEEFLAQLVDFLRRRDLSTSRVVVSLVHEKQASTAITVGLRQPSRCQQHLLQLLQIQLDRLTIPAPVIALRMQVDRFDAHLGESEQLLPQGRSPDSGNPGGTADNRLDLFMEQLQARLGTQPVRKVMQVAEHCPEYASQQQDPMLQAPRVRPAHSLPNPRPFWLLPTPRPLQVRSGRLYHQRAVTILSGPERIETRWWSGTDVRRDYYVAVEENGSRLWIYREKTGDRGWYLHGVFA